MKRQFFGIIYLALLFLLLAPDMIAQPREANKPIKYDIYTPNNNGDLIKIETVREEYDEWKNKILYEEIKYDGDNITSHTRNVSEYNRYRRLETSTNYTIEDGTAKLSDLTTYEYNENNPLVCNEKHWQGEISDLGLAHHFYYTMNADTVIGYTKDTYKEGEIKYTSAWDITSRQDGLISEIYDYGSWISIFYNGNRIPNGTLTTAGLTKTTRSFDKHGRTSRIHSVKKGMAHINNFDTGWIYTIETNYDEDGLMTEWSKMRPGAYLTTKGEKTKYQYNDYLLETRATSYTYEHKDKEWDLEEIDYTEYDGKGYQTGIRYEYYDKYHDSYKLLGQTSVTNKYNDFGLIEKREFYDENRHLTKKHVYHHSLTITGINAIKEDIKIYPNPAKNILNIDLNTKGLIVLYNATGTIVKRQMGFSGNNTVNVSELQSGLYIVKVNEKCQKVTLH